MVESASDSKNRKKRSRVQWDAAEGSKGGAGRTAWEALLDMDKYIYDVEETEPRSSYFGCGSGRSLWEVQLRVVWAWAMHFGFPQRILRVLCGYVPHQRRVLFEGCAADSLPTITAILPGSKWSGLLQRIVMHDPMSEDQKVYPQLKLEVYVDDKKIMSG